MNALLSTSVCVDWSAQIANMAVEALLKEVRLTPKPGLVDQRGSGAHKDLTFELMELSAVTLWDTFFRIANAAQQHETVDPLLRKIIGHEGRVGEQEMLKATLGVNTHRGAIWALGLLTASISVRSTPKTVDELVSFSGQLARYPDYFLKSAALSNGERIKAKYGIGGAREQAQKNFPEVIKGIKILYKNRLLNVDEPVAQLNTLLAIVSHLDDTCVLHRAGLGTLKWLQRQAACVLKAGGYGTKAGRKHYVDLEKRLLLCNASPGGAADLLSACLFIDALVLQGIITWKS